jgi:hypothetical protein
MASTKTGKITDTAAPPFATRNGAPASPGTSGKPTNFVRDASSAAQRAQAMKGADFTKDGRSQAPPPDDMQPDAWPSPAQSPGNIQGRADAASIPRDGATPPATPTSARGGQCDPGPQPARLPFKGLR